MRKVIYLLILSFYPIYLFSQATELIHYPIAIPFDVKYFQKNDTVFTCHIYMTGETTDSVKVTEVAIKTDKRWVTPVSKNDGSYSIIEFKKKKSSKWFKENNQNYLNAEFECKPKSIETHYTNEFCITKFCYFFNYVHIRSHCTPRSPEAVK